jgi:hypothetical protein
MARYSSQVAATCITYRTLARYLAHIILILIKHSSWLLAGATLLVCGCSSIGPGTIARDRFDYAVALGETDKRQLLRNIVRLRYLDAPVFVRVDSIINQYSLEGSVSFGAGFNSSFKGQDTQRIGGIGRWIDRPTITYSPVSGKVFARNLMTPIPPDAVLALVQAGWAADSLFRLVVRSINGADNESAAPTSRAPAEPEFRELLELWSRLRQERLLGLRREDSSATVKFYGYIDDEMAPQGLQQDLARLRELLGLPPDASEFLISYGLVADEPHEVALLTSSILQIMADLSWRVDVPEKHVQAGRTGSTFHGEDLFAASLFQVRRVATRPEDAYVAVFERGYWFYIGDDDVVSKRTFAILQILLSLTESTDTAKGPVVTIGS